MYYIFADGQLLYSSVQQENALILSPTGSMEAGRAGSIDFTMLPGHYLYFEIKKLKTYIKVFMDSEEIFNGRVLNWDTDFYGQRTVHCEGNLAYLLDSLQPPRDADMTPTEYLTSCISEHNLQVDVEKRFTLGTISVTGLPTTDLEFSNTSYRDTREAINTDLINTYGGILRTRSVGAVTYLDYISSYGSQSSQVIEFGSNILDLSENVSGSEVFTVLLPTGDLVDSGDASIPSWPLTIESVNSQSKLLEHSGGISRYGRIVQTENFSGITTALELKAAAEAYFERAYQEPPVTFSVKVLDLKLLGVAVDSLTVGKTYHVISPPHSIDATLTCLAIEYDFENVENTALTIGELITTPDSRNLSGTGSASISSAVGAAVGGKSGGSVGTAFKLITEGKDWVKIAANKIELVAGDVATNGAAIIVERGRIDLKVSKDDVVNQINISSEGINISATKVQITGTDGIIAHGSLAVGDLSAVNADLQNLKTGTTIATAIKAANLQSTGSISAGANITATGSLNGDTLNITTGSITTLTSSTINGTIINLNGTSLATLLSGKAATGHTHSAYAAFDHTHLTTYLGINATAADSSKLNNKSASSYVLASSISRTSASFVTDVVLNKTTTNVLQTMGGTTVNVIKTAYLTVTSNTYYFYT